MDKHNNTGLSLIGRGKCRDYWMLHACNVIPTRASKPEKVRYSPEMGALMLSVSIKHPDAEKFIDMKLSEGKVTGANVSVKIDDNFMNVVESLDSDYYQTFPIHHNVVDLTTDEQKDMKDLEYNKLYKGLVIDGIQTYFKKVDAKKIWDKIVHNAWKSAEPGILFWDKTLRESPARSYGEDWKEGGVNPCAELTLPKYDSCRLFSINLYSYLYKAFTKDAQLEDELLSKHIKKAMRLMDDMIDLEIEKIDRILSKIKGGEFSQVETNLWMKIRDKAIRGRRTGLGILGLGDLIAGLGYKYGTPEATKFSEVLHQLIATAAYESSIVLASERGAFPDFDKDELNSDSQSEFLKRMFSKDNPFMKAKVAEMYSKTGRRNIGLLTIAPTGSTSLMTQTTSGIEPVFSPYHFRRKKVVNDSDKVDFVDEMGDKFTEFAVFHKPFIQWYAIKENLSFEKAKELLSNCTSAELKMVFEKSPYFEATSQDVDYVEKVKMQGAVQKWIDHSISVTVNMPNHVTVETVDAVYREAHKSGCKGITVYRDGSRAGVLHTTSIKGKGEAENFEYITAVKRPKEVNCDVFFKQARGEKFIIFVGKINNKPYEIFAVPLTEKTKIQKNISEGTLIKVKKGHYKFVSKCNNYIIENLCDHMIETEQNETRTISGLLRHRVDPKYIANLIGKFATISSFHKVMEKVILTYVEDKSGYKCPECGEEMTMTEGCMKCTSCGYAHCG